MSSTAFEPFRASRCCALLLPILGRHFGGLFLELCCRHRPPHVVGIASTRFVVSLTGHSRSFGSPTPASMPARTAAVLTPPVAWKTSVQYVTAEWKPAFGKQESFYFFLCYPGRQGSAFLISTGELGPSPKGSDLFPFRLT